MKKALIAGLAVGVASAASGQITGVSHSPFMDGHLLGGNPAGPTLWDQQPDPAQPGFVDQNFLDLPSFATYTVSDVNFGSGVVITDITTYYTQGIGAWPIGAATATLNIFGDDNSGLPSNGDDPSGGTSVAVNIAAGPNGLEVTASGLNIALGAGDYWVGLTPELAFSSFGQEFLQGSADVKGSPSASRNPGAAFGIGLDWVDTGVTFGGVADWNGAITILGTPTPGSLALLGLGGLVANRRRR